jgi:trimeric autotransporter adhesin
MLKPSLFYWVLPLLAVLLSSCASSVSDCFAPGVACVSPSLVSSEVQTAAGTFWPTLGVGATAALVQLNNPMGTTLDSLDNLYIVDRFNQVIRKVDAGTGLVSNFAGTGTAGYSGDGGPASSAELNTPCAIGMDSAGNFYILDAGNHVVRKVDALSKIITTVAGNGAAGYSGDGGPALNAQIVGSSLAVSGSGDIYFSDSTHNVIRKVSATTKLIQTYAGNGTRGFAGDGSSATSAELAGPAYIALDAGGNLYISDNLNCAIRLVSSSTGKISTFAGVGPSHCADNGDGGLATSATLANPQSVGLDGSGNVFIGDESLIRKVTAATGKINTIAGTFGNTTDSGDGGLAVSATMGNVNSLYLDSSGNLYFTEGGNYNVRKISVASNLINTIAGAGSLRFGVPNFVSSAELNDPVDVALDAEGNIYIADNLENLVRKYNPTSETMTTVAGTGIQGYTGDGGQATSATLSGPGSVNLDGSGNIFIADNNNCVIRKVAAATGIITTVVGTGTSGYTGDSGAASSAKIGNISAIRFDATGNLYLADKTYNVIRKVNAATGVITTVVGTGSAGYTGDGGLASAAKINLPSAIAFDSSGNLYISDSSNFVIRKVNLATGVITTIAGIGQSGYSGDGGPALAAKLKPSGGLAIDNSGNIYSGDVADCVIRQVNAVTGEITTFAGTGSAGYLGDGGSAALAAFNEPFGLATDSNDELFISDSGNEVVRKISFH